MGYAAAAYQYGMIVAHAYWIAAIPAILFLSLVMMPFYYICKTHSVPGYLKLRFGEGPRALAGVSFAVMTILMSGINMYAMAVIMKVILGWNIQLQHLGQLHHGRALRDGGRVALGDFQRGASVLPDLARLPVDPHHRPDRDGRVERHGAAHSREPAEGEPRARRTGLHPPLAQRRPLLGQPDGHPLDRYRARLGSGHQLRVLDHGLSCRPARDGWRAACVRRSSAQFSARS